MTVTRTPVPALAARARSVAASPVREILALTARPEVISFAGGLPAPELFDAEGIRAAYDRVLAEQAGRVLQYSTTEGDPALRAAVAGRLTARGLATDVDDLVVTGGSQQGLSLVATALLEPGDVVLVENPTYLAALQTFGFAGARVVPVPTDADGVDPVALEELVLRERPKLLYLIPNFQNPTGRTLPLARRRAVADRRLWVLQRASAAVLLLFVAGSSFVLYWQLLNQMSHFAIQDVETIEGLLFIAPDGRLSLHEDYHNHPESRLLLERLLEIRSPDGTLLYRNDRLGNDELGGKPFAGEGVESFSERSGRLKDGSRILLVSRHYFMRTSAAPDGRGLEMVIRLGYREAAAARLK